MSSREPLWYCHECHAEMRPLMVPDPHCASCNGTFVEKLENPADDPREFQRPHDGLEDDEIPPNMEGFLAGLRTLLRGVSPNSPPGATGSNLNAQRSQSEGPANRPSRMNMGGGNGLTFRIQGSPGGQSTVFIGGSPRTGGSGSGPTPSTEGPDAREDRNAINGPLMAQYLLAMLANRPNQGQAADPLSDLFGGLFGMPEAAENGRWGDYVFNQEALDQIITQIMETSNASAPVPATEEIMNDLPREVLEEGSPLLQKDCAVCKEQFQLNTEDPDEQVVVILPCKHPFHETCIVPWLKSSGTCPVCRYQLIRQPEHHAPGPGPPGSSGSGRPSSPNASQQQPTSPGAPGLLGSLFGFGSSSGSGSGNNHGSSNTRPSSESSRATRSTREDHIPGGWGEQLD